MTSSERNRELDEPGEKPRCESLEKWLRLRVSRKAERSHICLHYTLLSTFRAVVDLTEAVRETQRCGVAVGFEPSYSHCEGLGSFSKIGTFVCLVQTIWIP